MTSTALRMLLVALSALGLAGTALAQTEAPKAVVPASNAVPEPDYTLAFNVGGVTDYRYRGISQTRLNPTLQGGVDLSSRLGFYAGAWASGIKWIRDAGGNAGTEVDLYGGYKGKAGDFGYDVGVLQYYYARNHLDPGANTTEIYVAGSYDVATLKYSHSVTNLFGFADSRNSGYLDLAASFDVGHGITLVPHVGYQRVAHNSDFSYADYSVVLSKDLYGVTLSAALVATSTRSYRGASNENLGRTALVLGVKKVF